MFRLWIVSCFQKGFASLSNHHCTASPAKYPNAVFILWIKFLAPDRLRPVKVLHISPVQEQPRRTPPSHSLLRCPVVLPML
ncbi:hypothetical protein QQF64_027299 [Cirrhinus molitorella]|uniref:Secreted protein n=1 Tax=Cirrhinus molitorella TaxID=172907 RepID=A0ABR3NC05_9TELE